MALGDNVVLRNLADMQAIEMISRTVFEVGCVSSGPCPYPHLVALPSLDLRTVTPSYSIRVFSSITWLLTIFYTFGAAFDT